MNKTCRRLLIAALVTLQSGTARAADDAFDFFNEEAKVVTATRRSQGISEVPLAVDVVTAAEIRASGAAHIWDLLRFRAGMDVLDGRSADGNRAVVSARGIPHEFASNLLVLVDGRGVTSLNQGGVYWDQLPVQLQDIERIEIVRGPGSALYGTGAGVGVVNILTKKPSGKTAFEADTRAGNLGAVQAFQAVETSLFKKASLRASHTFQQERGFPQAPNSRADDSVRKNVFNLRAAVPLSERTDLELLGGGSWSSAGLADPAKSVGADFENHFATLKLLHRLSEDSSVEASASRGDSISDTPLWSIVRNSRQIQHDAEVLHRFAWADRRLNTTYGMSYRGVQLATPDFYGSSRPRLELYRGYLQQSAKVTDIVSVQGAVSAESSNVAGVHPNYQIAAVAAPVPEHSYRASYSVARTLRDFIPVYGQLAPEAAVRVQSNPGLSEPYRVTSYEAGYHGSWLERRLQTDVSLFYTRIDHFHQIVFQSFSFPVTTLRFQDYDDAIVRGGELQAKYVFGRGRWVYANYSYERTTDKVGDGPYITRNAPTHKLNFGGAASFARGFSASANLGYKDAYIIQPVSGGASALVPFYWRLDARLAYVPERWRDMEFYVAGQNLLKPRHTEFANGVDVARTYAAGVSVKLGMSE